MHIVIENDDRVEIELTFYEMEVFVKLLLLLIAYNGAWEMHTLTGYWTREMYPIIAKLDDALLDTDGRTTVTAILSIKECKILRGLLSSDGAGVDLSKKFERDISSRLSMSLSEFLENVVKTMFRGIDKRHRD